MTAAANHSARALEWEESDLTARVEVEIETGIEVEGHGWEVLGSSTLHVNYNTESCTHQSGAGGGGED